MYLDLRFHILDVEVCLEVYPSKTLRKAAEMFNPTISTFSSRSKFVNPLLDDAREARGVWRTRYGHSDGELDEANKIGEMWHV